MNILLWILQGLLAAHTAMGGFWKFSNSSRDMPSLAAIPGGLWVAMGVIELLIAVALVVPSFARNLAFLAPIAASLVALEMLAFCLLHLLSGDKQHGHLVYWLVVAVWSGLVAWGRFRTGGA